MVVSLRRESGSVTFNPGAIFCTPAVTTSAPAGGPETSASSLRYPCTTTLINSTVPAGSAPARRTTHSAGCPLDWVIALAGIAATEISAAVSSAISVAVAPSGSGLGLTGFNRARYVRVCGAACCESSRRTTSKLWSGALASDALYLAFVNEAK